MSILERMRGSTDSTPMQIILVLIVVAFIGWFSLPQAETVQVQVEVQGGREKGRTLCGATSGQSLNSSSRERRGGQERVLCQARWLIVH